MIEVVFSSIFAVFLVFLITVIVGWIWDTHDKICDIHKILKDKK